jgi:hypothetical protein
MERLCTSTSSLQHAWQPVQVSPPSAGFCRRRRCCPRAGSAAPPPRRQAAADSKRVKPLRAASAAWAAESEVADSRAPAGKPPVPSSYRAACCLRSVPTARRPCLQSTLCVAAATAAAARCLAGLQAAKQRLLAAIAGTGRGGEARALQRGLVEEAQASPLRSPCACLVCSAPGIALPSQGPAVCMFELHTCLAVKHQFHAPTLSTPMHVCACAPACLAAGCG